MVRRTKDEAEQTRNTILNAAETVFYQNGVARTSMEQIARAAHVTRGAIYWHFEDKIEVCEAMMQRVFLPQEDILDRLAASPGDTPLDDLKKACIDALKLIATDKRRQRVVTILMFRCEYVQEMTSIMERRRQCKDHMLDRSLRLFQRAKTLKMLAPGWTPRLAAISLQALMTGLITGGLEGRRDFDLARSGPLCLEAFFRALGR
jgi:AcrR family transcriptional regulator